ncbi:MAG: hypothetical protein ACKO96_32690 [Flammeovirgaceae bacterium]
MIILCSISFLMDAFRRINKVLTEGEVLSKYAIVAISLAYLAEVLYFIVYLISGKVNLASAYIVILTFVIANATLATLLYRLGVD